MLKVDLGQLDRKGRIRIDADVSPDDPVWDDIGVRLAGPVTIRLVAQTTGPDVLVRGEFRTAIYGQCRRCLQPLERPAADELTLVYRRGLSEIEAQAQEAYSLAPAAHEVDLGPALREHLILAAPEYSVCDESCRGLCAECGANLNDGSCGCGGQGSDPRWNVLRELTK